MDLSIVIPCYNSEKYLNSCLKSVCDQIQNEKIEVLIVDDASKDKTSQIINSYKKKVKFIEIFKNKKNSGVSVSRNLALRKAKGKYILFLDSDDEIIKDSISQLLNYINKNYVDVVILRNKNIDHKNFIDKNQIYNLKKNSKSIIHNIKNFNLFRSTCWNFLVKKNFITKNKILFKDIKIFEDQFFVSKILSEAKTFKIYRKPIYNRRLHEPRTLSKTVGFWTAESCLKVIIELSKTIYEFKENNNKIVIKFLISRIKFVENLLFENLMLCEKKEIKHLVNLYFKNLRYFKNLKKINSQILKIFLQNKISAINAIQKMKKNKIGVFKKNIKAKTSYLIFCAWYYSEIILKICLKEKIKVNYVLDNNIFYKSKRLHNKKIILPINAKKFINKNYGILICNKNKKYCKQITSQLINLGFMPKNLIKVEI